MKTITWTGALLIFIVLSSSQLRADEVADLRSRVAEATAAFKDMRATVIVSESNRKELEKMGKAFAETYQFKKASVAFAMPDSLKMNGDLGMVRVEFISADNTRVIRIPSLGYKKKQDISATPVLHSSSLDVGIVTAAIWDYYTVSLSRTEKGENGDTVYVLHLQPGHSLKACMIWVDGSNFKLLQLDRLLNKGELKVRTKYTDHKKINGVWVPARAEVLNPEGKRAAVTETQDVQINAGIDGKEFE